MALFRRKKTTTDIPELQEYYAQKQANNSLGAWLLALASLILTVLIILALFFGIRWVWREIRGNDNSSSTTEQVVVEESESSQDSQPEEGANTGNTDQSGSSSSSNSSSSGSADGQVSSNGSTGTSSTSTTTPNSGTSSSQNTTEDLPNSGPGNLVSIFLAVTGLGYLVYRRRELKKN